MTVGQHIVRHNFFSKGKVGTCSRAERSEVPLMLAWEGEGDGGLWCGLWWGCCSCCCCWYLLFRWSIKASLLRSMSALWRLVRASRLWAALTVWRCSEVCTRPTLEKRRAPFPSVRYSRGYSRSSVEIMWLPPRSGSEGQGEKSGREDEGKKGKKKEGVESVQASWITIHTRTQRDLGNVHTHRAGTHEWKQMEQK